MQRINLKKYVIALMTGLMMISLTSCGGGGEKGGGTPVSDLESYDLGAEQASILVSKCGGDTMKVRGALLEVHAIGTRVEQERGREALEEYRRGFEEKINELEPDLGANIF